MTRAADRLGLRSARSPSGHLRFDTGEVARLVRELGVTPSIDGLGRAQVQVLAALARAPLGLSSRRAVARVAGLSATAASRALRDLVDRGLAELRRETVAEGTARTAEIAYANHLHPRWPELAAQLSRARPAAGDRRGRGSAAPRIPARHAHVFWNAPVASINVAEHGPCVARRVLLEGDTQALAWAAETLRGCDWRDASRTRGFDPRHRALAESLATAADS